MPLSCCTELLVPETLEDLLERKENVRRVSRVIGRLTPAQREAVLFCCILGFSPRELARIKKVSGHVISARLSRARKSFRRLWLSLYGP